jgi:hypothetical protein
LSDFDQGISNVRRNRRLGLDEQIAEALKRDAELFVIEKLLDLSRIARADFAPRAVTTFRRRRSRSAQSSWYCPATRRVYAASGKATSAPSEGWQTPSGAEDRGSRTPCRASAKRDAPCPPSVLPQGSPEL